VRYITYINRVLTAAGLVGALLATCVASAAAIPISPGPLGAGMDTISACDADGFTFAATIDTSGKVTAVTVSGIDVACAGAILRVTLASGTTSVGSGSATLPSSGFSGSASVSVNPTPSSTGVDRIFAVAEGP
jgi:hypothetical protein